MYLRGKIMTDSLDKFLFGIFSDFPSVQADSFLEDSQNVLVLGYIFHVKLS